jgi:hypothetical protein
VTDFHDRKDELRRELTADILRGRARIPRDAGGHVIPSFLPSQHAGELPHETSSRAGGGQWLSEVLAAVPRPPAGMAPIAPALKVAQLEQLERELSGLLSSSAPDVWSQIRAPLRRLLRRARRELRAVDRSTST